MFLVNICEGGTYGTLSTSDLGQKLAINELDILYVVARNSFRPFLRVFQREYYLVVCARPPWTIDVDFLQLETSQPCTSYLPTKAMKVVRLYVQGPFPIFHRVASVIFTRVILTQFIFIPEHFLCLAQTCYSTFPSILAHFV